MHYIAVLVKGSPAKLDVTDQDGRPLDTYHVAIPLNSDQVKDPAKFGEVYAAPSAVKLLELHNRLTAQSLAL